MKKKILIVIYSHPEYYPPTLNAIEYLSETYRDVFVLCRNYKGFDWKYPSNVKLFSYGKAINPNNVKHHGILKKLYSFFNFTFHFWKTAIHSNPHTILLYDVMPLLSYRVCYFFFNKPKLLWYHNHDVADPYHLKKYSLSWFAWKTEEWVFPQLDIFSLPSVERKQYFPMEKLKGQFFFLPNFPSRKIYGRYASLDKQMSNSIKILYQGSIGPLHGLEEIIGVLNIPVSEKKLCLVLKGFIGEDYKKILVALAKEKGVTDRIIFIAPTGYAEVISNAFSCDIGIGIHQKNDIMNSTLGTASNKIYEYAATGMPVLIYDNPHFRGTLKDRKWVFFTDTSKSSLLKCLHEVISNYDFFSKEAINDFEGQLCFEKYFEPITNFID